ncbi:MAG: hypothetical protein LBK42_01950 [Propionibacteriaceae bacterium]|jgi:hypothetical protein|nr:hypothetical protein [Propionibacteriaceae bacterium]
MTDPRVVEYLRLCEDYRVKVELWATAGYQTEGPDLDAMLAAQRALDEFVDANGLAGSKLDRRNDQSPGPEWSWGLIGGHSWTWPFLLGGES